MDTGSDDGMFENGAKRFWNGYTRENNPLLQEGIYQKLKLLKNSSNKKNLEKEHRAFG